MTPPRILIAGIGNIFLGDDAFGSEVARRLAERAWPPGVQVIDFGIRGLDLAYALLDGCELAILIDAMPRGEAPGTLYVIEPDISGLAAPDAGQPLVDAHTMDPLQVLRLVESLGGGNFGRLLLVGCVPERIGALEEGRIGLSAAVAAAVERAVEIIQSLVDNHLEPELQISKHS